MDKETLTKCQSCLEDASFLLDPATELEFKHMFGGVCAYVEGRVFASLSNVGLALKLSQESQNELLKEPEAKYLQYEPGTPPSKQYVVVPPAMVDDPTGLSRWLGESIAFVKTLPSKKKKGRSPRKNV